MSSRPRVNLGQHAAGVYDALTALAAEASAYAEQTDLGTLLAELVRIRASQVNGCAYCLDLHHRAALRLGEDPRRLAVLSAWREAVAWFSDRERAALELAEAVTLVSDGQVGDEAYGRAAAQLTSDEIAAVAWLTITINAFNRVAVTSRYGLPPLATTAP